MYSRSQTKFPRNRYSRRATAHSAKRKKALLTALLLPPIIGLAACSSTNTSTFTATGTWAGTVTNGVLSIPLSVTITDANGALSGTGTVLGIALGNFTGTRSDHNGTLTFPPTTTRSSTIKLQGQFSGDNFSGDYIVNGTKTGTFSARR